MTNRRFTSRITGILVTLAVVFWGGAAVAQGSQATDSRLIVAIPAPLTTLDPHYGSTRLEMTVLENVFDTLVRRAPDGGLDSALAETWGFSEDGLTARFELRQGVTFHNGEPFSAEAVKFSYDRAMADETLFQYKSLYSVVESVNVIDEFTVEFSLTDTAPALFTNLTNLPILPPAYLAEVGDREFVRHPVGTGPYSFVSVDAGGTLVLSAYEDFYLGRAPFANLEFHPVPDAATQLAAFLAGDIDIIGPVSSEAVEVVRSTGAAVGRIVEVPALRRIYIGLRADIPPFDNVDVRHAVSQAINRQAIIEGLLGGGARESNSPILDLEFGYDSTLPANTFDPEGAKELLSTAGYPNGFTVQFETPQGRYPKDAEIAQAIAAQLEEIGINAQVDVTEWNRIQERKNARQAPPMYLIGWGGGGTFDPENTLSTTFVCEGGSPGSRLYHCNPELDDLIARQRVEANPEKRAELIHEAQRLIQQDQVWVPLLNYTLAYAVNADVDWQPRPDEAYWMFAAEPVNQ